MRHQKNSVHATGAENLKCTSSLLLNAPLAYVEQVISNVNPGLAVHGASDIGLPLTSRETQAIVESCRMFAVHKAIPANSDQGEGIEDSAWHLGSDRVKVKDTCVVDGCFTGY